VRVLGVDLGLRRTGLALSDPAGVTCSPLEIVQEREKGSLLLRIMQVAEDYEVDRIIVGLPRPLAGGTNRQVEEVLAFVESLSSRSEVPVATWDERFTSKLARRGRPGPRADDAVAACYMLQSYLDSNSSSQGDT
jgi:putative pre-16S rRNA nuclease